MTQTRIQTLKTATYSAMHLTVAVTVAYALTRDVRAALAIGLLEPFVQTFAYAIHERLWGRVASRRSRPVCRDARADEMGFCPAPVR